jgi:outer membrane lipoprotein SlyB
MKTLLSSYQERREKLKTQLENVEKPEQVVQLIQHEINRFTEFQSEYISGLTPQQARLATVMLKMLEQYTSILMLVEILNHTQSTPESSNDEVRSQNKEGLTKFSLMTILPLHNIAYLEKIFSARTQTILQQIQHNREVISSLLAGGVAGTVAGGSWWGLIGAITGGIIGKIVQEIKLPENSNNTIQVESQKEGKVSINIDKLLDNLYQAFQSIDLTVAAYGTREEKASKLELENNLDLLEYLQDLMADTLDKQILLPTAVRRRIEQAATILRHYGIEARVYQPLQEEKSGIEALSMFYFEPSLDPQVTDYITLKHALVKDNQVLLPGSVIEPVTSDQ